MVQTGNSRFPLIVIVLIAVGLRTAVFNPYGAIDADELWQYLERAHRLASGYGIVTWEGRHGIRNAIMPQLLAGPMWLGAQLAPGTNASLMAGRLLGAVIGFTSVLSAYAIGQRESRSHGLAAAFAVGIWAECVYFSDSLLSENFGASAILAGCAFAIGAGPERKRWFAAGFLFGLGVLFRFPYAVFAGVAAIGLCRADRLRWTWVAGGGLAAILLGAASDLLAGDLPFAWLIRNVEANLIEGRAKDFGTAGALYYPAMHVNQYGLGAAAIAALGCLCPRRFRVLLVAALAELAVHSLLAHKEFRFVYLGSTTFVILAATAMADLADRLTPSSLRGGGLHRAVPFYFLAILSGTSWFVAKLQMPIQYSGNAGRLAAQAGRDPAICGLAISDLFRYTVPTVFFGRNLPVYDRHQRLGFGLEPDQPVLPLPVARAANALIAPGGSRVPPSFVTRQCLGRTGSQVCLSVRPGPCDASGASAYALQNVLTANDL